MTADPEMVEAVASAGVPVVIMHTAGNPADMQRDPGYRDTVGEIVDWLGARIEHAVAHGIPRSRIIIDPGIGFGKRLSDNLLLIQSLASFQKLIVPFWSVLRGSPSSAAYSTRRKSTGWRVRRRRSAERSQRRQYHRVHDVLAMRRVVRMTDAICRARQE